jgi:hypothetical protein
MSDLDRRKMQRFDLQLPAKLFWTRENKKQESIELVTHNICAGGTYLMTNSPLPEGTEVKMDITLQTDQSHKSMRRLSILDISGHVIRTDHHGMAICFDRKYKILPQYVNDF